MSPWQHFGFNLFQQSSDSAEQKYFTNYKKIQSDQLAIERKRKNTRLKIFKAFCEQLKLNIFRKVE